MRASDKLKCAECGEEYELHEIRKSWVEYETVDRMVLPGTKERRKHRTEWEPCDCGCTEFYHTVTLE